MKFSKDIEEQWQAEYANYKDNGLNVYEIWAKKRREFFKKHGNLAISPDQSQKLESLRDKYKGNRIFIIGNGPSLKKINFDNFRNEFTFGVNRINLLYDKTDWRPTFYTVNDWEVGPDNADELYTHVESNVFLPKRFDGMIDEIMFPDLYVYSSNNDTDGLGSFSDDITKGVVMGGTVLTLPIQIACYMGFNPIYLIGVDLSYKVNEEVKQTGKLIKDNNIKQLLESVNDDDPNHFDPRYFGKGKKWHNPNPKRMALGFFDMYQSLKERGIDLINATIGGNLNEVPRANFESLFNKSKPAKLTGGSPLVNISNTNNIERMFFKLIIVIPCYNCANYIEETLNSVKDAFTDSLAIILVDDGSTDNIMDTLLSVNKIPIYYIKQDNSGRSAARNTGLAALKSFDFDYFAMQDADDKYLPDSLNKLVKFLEYNNKYDAVSGSHKRITKSGEQLSAKVMINRDIRLKDFLDGPPVMLQSSVFRASVIAKDMILFDEVQAGEDWLYLAKLSSKIQNWRIIPLHIFEYRATLQAIKKTTFRYATDMLITYTNVVEEIQKQEILNKDTLNESANKQISKVCGRLLATGNYFAAQRIIQHNVVNSDIKTIKDRRVVTQFNFWCKHLDIKLKSIYRRRIGEI